MAEPGSGDPPRSRRSSYQPFPPLSPTSSDQTPHVPVRHPRPLTAAELHMELEKEQEAIVNRLTRELSALRAHSASVASTASSAASASAPNQQQQLHMSPTFAPDALDPAGPSGGSLLPLSAGPTHPTGARREARSGSNASATSSTFLASASASAALLMLQQAQHAQAGGGPTRYDEVAVHRAEMEEAWRENVQLKARVIELEAALRARLGDKWEERRGS